MAVEMAAGSYRNERHCQSSCGRGHFVDIKSFGRHENVAYDRSFEEATIAVLDTNRSARGHFQFVSRPGPDVGEDVSICGRIVYDKRMATN
tara:strand:+ start:1118 stop:1390 length:273 start_codon:yes stop_codon:yes gene_type:complete